MSYEGSWGKNITASAQTQRQARAWGGGFSNKKFVWSIANKE